MKIDIKKLDFEKMGGLIPVVVQNYCTKEVLMLGFMDEAAVIKTLADNKVTFYSRTKKRLWQKGETSGNFLIVKEILIDCDSDSLLIMADPVGPTCHMGARSCFGAREDFLRELFEIIKKRKLEMPKRSYTSELFEEGLSKILAKIDEESAEVIQAAESEGKQRLIEESCDLLYHLYVLLVNENIDLSDIEKELKQRNG